MRTPVRALLPPNDTLPIEPAGRSERRTRSATIPEDDRELLHEIYKELIEYKTTDRRREQHHRGRGHGGLAAGGGISQPRTSFIGGALPHKGNVVARLSRHRREGAHRDDGASGRGDGSTCR